MENLDNLRSVFVEQRFVKSLCVVSFVKTRENGACDETESESKMLWQLQKWSDETLRC